MLEAELGPWTLGRMRLRATASIVAGLGVYSAMAYAVNERMRELGIRIALGTANNEIMALVVSTAARVVGAGILVGVVLVLMSGKLVAAMLYATSPKDPLVILTASATLMFLGIIASALPAWRASRSDPVTVLRTE